MTLIILNFTHRTVNESFGGVKLRSHSVIKRPTSRNPLFLIRFLLKNINKVYIICLQLNNKGLILEELKIKKGDVQTNDSALSLLSPFELVILATPKAYPGKNRKEKKIEKSTINFPLYTS